MRLTWITASVLLSLNVAAAANAPAAGPSREEAGQGFVSLFDGKTLDGWQGSVKGFVGRRL